MVIARCNNGRSNSPARVSASTHLEEDMIMSGLAAIHESRNVPQRAQAERPLLAANTIITLGHIITVNEVLSTAVASTPQIGQAPYVRCQTTSLGRLQDLLERIHESRVGLTVA